MPFQPARARARARSPCSLVALSALAAAAADRASLDCPLRQLQLDYAQQLQPTRAAVVFQELADALNGAQEAQNCSVAPKVTATRRQPGRALR